MQAEMERIKAIGSELQLLQHTEALLGWDQHTGMPPSGAEERARQSGLLVGLYHEKLTSPAVGDLLKRLGVSEAGVPDDSGLSELDQAYLRYLHRIYARATKLTKQLVEKLAEETSKGFGVWVEARQKADFSLFEKQLETIVGLVREKAEMLGYDDHPYDALLDEYEPWAKTEAIGKVFAAVKTGLVDLLQSITDAPQVDDSFLNRNYLIAKQEEFGRKVLIDLGYDFARGRLDVSPHPFTTTLGVDDVRITTRYNETFFNTGIFGTIHECGHGLYELGFGDDIRGNLLAEGASLGIHESQSRTWENQVGRSLPFWEHYFPVLQELFTENLATVSVEQFYKGINKVAPSQIRVEADEVTYNLHIILRFELEVALITGKVNVADLPGAWNEKSRELLGTVPDNDGEGVLQDLHWSSGAIGYFPTYSLGNLYGAQFFSAARKAIPNLESDIGKGDFSSLLTWLRENIHQHGSRYSADELCSRVTGESLQASYFLDYLNGKFRRIYEL